MNSNYWQEKRSQARVLRKNMTPEEKKLYYNFFKADGIRVRRQYVIGAYIVDFCVIKKKLIIELDGRDHYTGAGMEYDEKRDRRLAACGYTVLRFENAQVRENFSAVCSRIEKHLTT